MAGAEPAARIWRDVSERLYGLRPVKFRRTSSIATAVHPTR
jgi:hypothetical protein